MQGLYYIVLITVLRPVSAEAHSCKIFYACLISPEGEYKMMTFHCPRGTAFNQSKQLCDESQHEDCDQEDIQQWNRNIFKTLEKIYGVEKGNEVGREKLVQELFLKSVCVHCSTIFTIQYSS